MKKTTVGFLMIALTMGMLGCDKKSTSKSGSLDTDVKKYSYALGQQFGSNIAELGVELDKKTVLQAIESALSNKESLLNDEEIQQSMIMLRDKRMESMKAKTEESKVKGEAFLENNKAKEGVVTTESGLQYKILEEGTGKTPTAKDRVTVHYKGTLIDGTEFDSSIKRGTPATFAVEGVIPGWTEALQLMKEGAKWQLFIPSDLAYGTMDRPQIPGNSVLIFDVELIEIAKAE